MEAKLLDDDFFIKNAILCFLYYYPKHKWAPIYEELASRDKFTRTQRTTRTRKSNAKKTDD